MNQTTTIIRVSGSIIAAFGIYRIAKAYHKDEKLSETEKTLAGAAVLTGFGLLGIGLMK